MMWTVSVQHDKPEEYSDTYERNVDRYSDRPQRVDPDGLEGRLRCSAGLTAVAILTVALAAFTAVRAVLLNTLPYLYPERLVRVFDDLRGSNSRDVGTSAPELSDLRDESGVFEDLPAVWSSDANLTGGDHPQRVEILGTGTNFDPITFGALTMLLAGVALLVCLIPAQRATALNPR
jgi:hypothetical protein